MLLQGDFGRITLQLDKIEIKKFFLIFLFNFFIHLLTYNSFVPYKLHDFWYEMQKKTKKYTKEKKLIGRKEVMIWKDFRFAHVLETVWEESIQHVMPDCFV